MRQQLSTCALEPWGLRTESPARDDPGAGSEITWLLPRSNLRLTSLRPASRHARRGPSLITAVRVRSDQRAWWTTDLLLGLEVRPGMPTRICQVAEFSAAVSSGLLGAEDADIALGVVHRTLTTITRHGHDMRDWLRSLGVHDRWPF